MRVKKTYFFYLIATFSAVAIALLAYLTYSRLAIDEPLLKMIEGRAVRQNNFQIIRTSAKRGQYSPNVIFVKKDVPLKIVIFKNEEHGCFTEIIFPDLGIREKLPKGKCAFTLSFTPREEGKFLFTCGMKMVKGVLVVNK